MKMSATADELDEMCGMDDATLAKYVRDSLAKFRASRAEDDLENADPSTPRKGGPSTSTLENPASRAANGSANDSAERLRSLGLSERHIREIQNPTSVSADDHAAAAKLIKGYDRL